MKSKVIRYISQLAASVCMKCGRLFDSKAELHNHQASNHSVGKPESHRRQSKDVRKLTNRVQTNHKNKAAQKHQRNSDTRRSHKKRAVQTKHNLTDTSSPEVQSLALTKPCQVLLDSREVSRYLPVQLVNGEGDQTEGLTSSPTSDSQSTDGTYSEDERDALRLGESTTLTRLQSDISNLTKPCSVLLDPLEDDEDQDCVYDYFIIEVPDVPYTLELRVLLDSREVQQYFHNGRYKYFTTPESAVVKTPNASKPEGSSLRNKTSFDLSSATSQDSSANVCGTELKTSPKSGMPLPGRDSSDDDAFDTKLKRRLTPVPALQETISSDDDSFDNRCQTNLKRRKTVALLSTESSDDDIPQRKIKRKSNRLSPSTLSGDSSESSQDEEGSNKLKESFDCKKCDKKFPLSTLLKVHKCTIKKTLFKCQICNINYNNKYDLDVHNFKIHATWFKMNIKNIKPKVIKKQVFKCNYCKSYFKTKSYIRKHILTCQSIKVYKKCVDDSKLKLFKCTVCDKNFTTQKNIKVHELAVHLKQKNYYCFLCKKQFFRLDILKAHVEKIHRKHKKNYVCQHCKKEFSSKSYLDEHTATAHKKELNLHTVMSTTDKKLNLSIDTCHICGKIFKSVEDLKEHISNIHVEKIKHKCVTCEEEFDLQWQLQLHKSTVHTYMYLKNYKCSCCKKFFKTKQGLSSHEISKHNIKPTPRKYECPMCENTFKYENNLKDHQKNAHKIYHCYICNISIDGVENLRIHAAKYHSTSNKKDNH